MALKTDKTYGEEAIVSIRLYTIDPRTKSRRLKETVVCSDLHEVDDIIGMAILAGQFVELAPTAILGGIGEDE